MGVQFYTCFSEMSPYMKHNEYFNNFIVVVVAAAVLTTHPPRPTQAGFSQAPYHPARGNSASRGCPFVCIR